MKPRKVRLSDMQTGRNGSGKLRRIVWRWQRVIGKICKVVEDLST